MTNYFPQLITWSFSNKNEDILSKWSANYAQKSKKDTIVCGMSCNLQSLHSVWVWLSTQWKCQAHVAMFVSKKYAFYLFQFERYRSNLCLSTEWATLAIGLAMASGSPGSQFALWNQKTNDSCDFIQKLRLTHPSNPHRLRSNGQTFQWDLEYQRCRLLFHPQTPCWPKCCCCSYEFAQFFPPSCSWRRDALCKSPFAAAAIVPNACTLLRPVWIKSIVQIPLKDISANMKLTQIRAAACQSICSKSMGSEAFLFADQLLSACSFVDQLLLACSFAFGSPTKSLIAKMALETSLPVTVTMHRPFELVFLSMFTLTLYLSWSSRIVAPPRPITIPTLSGSISIVSLESFDWLKLRPGGLNEGEIRVKNIRN